ncbi:Poly(ADP-ribose) polymerase, catalytic domain-containing protein [Artemisia annua]|uniref:Poly(ADP-ribose) polymerase, catalytic domain-containing protein n=1 Tax=Artemisia annua TaxID=35608 RepID=A0A2U1LTH8_ARTAN|nr:Poly(ADP-ribose) polymerase, catalytic domain-containing protein [Artemisia annua]
MRQLSKIQGVRSLAPRKSSSYESLHVPVLLNTDFYDPFLLLTNLMTIGKHLPVPKDPGAISWQAEDLGASLISIWVLNNGFSQHEAVSPSNIGSLVQEVPSHMWKQVKLQFTAENEVRDQMFDDLVSPKNYFIWSSQMNTHILLEFVISFKTQRIVNRSQLNGVVWQTSFPMDIDSRSHCKLIQDVAFFSNRLVSILKKANDAYKSVTVQSRSSQTYKRIELPFKDLDYPELVQPVVSISENLLYYFFVVPAIAVTACYVAYQITLI